MRTICAVTVGRSDWGIYLPVLKAVSADPSLRLHLIAAGAHLVNSFGNTIEEITRDGFCVNDRVDMLLANDSPQAVAVSMGLGTIGFSQIYERVRPDLLLVLGDRFEMHAAALAATPFRIPIAHIHGGEVTQGAIDEAYRHAITKYSHLHFVSTAEHGRRVMQLGEETWRIHISGAPALDNLADIPLMSRDELSDRIDLDLKQDPILVTMHPVTLQHDQEETQIRELLDALREIDLPVVITRPNADAGHSRMEVLLEEFCRCRPNVRLVSSLGIRAYFSIMKIARVMAGNSSSGIIEAASFGLPVVNIGIRQAGRPRSPNVLDSECRSQDITAALNHAMSAAFRDSLTGMKNIYGDGTASGRIVRVLRDVPIDEKLVLKSFRDWPVTAFERKVA